MHVAEPRFEPDDGFTARRETEMPGFDDAGMHRADRDPVQMLALDREKRVGRTAGGIALRIAERMAEPPAPVIQPGPCVGQADGLEPEQVLDRPFEAYRGRMQFGHGRKLPVRAGQAQDADRSFRLFEQRKVHGTGFAPEIEQRDASLRKTLGCEHPGIGVHDRTRPRPMLGHAVPALQQFAERRRIRHGCRHACLAHPRIPAT